ncbi:MAG: DUF2339 domain-containing protein [Eubacterium sp.]|nr:DUF2339 domain-containing protein [Eubacterium sp.]
MSDLTRLEEELIQNRKMLEVVNSKLISLEKQIADIKNNQNIQGQVQNQMNNLDNDPLITMGQSENPGDIPKYEGGALSGVQNGNGPVTSSQNGNGSVTSSQLYSPYRSVSSGNNEKTIPDYRQAHTNNNQAYVNNNQAYAYNQQAPVYKHMEKERKPANMESILGKNIMGIAASVLIFISFILFAVLLIPILTDGIKVALMLTVSFGIAGFGLFMWLKKNKENSFFLSLLACGVGAIYISLFMCNAYFHIINDIVLYILILLWAVGVFWLSKYKLRLFEIIGDAGILVSIFFGAISCSSSGDTNMIMVLTVYSIVGIAVFMVPRIQDNTSLILHGIFSLVGMFILNIVDNDILKDFINDSYQVDIQLYISLILIGLFSLGIILLFMWKLSNENANPLVIISAIYSFIFTSVIEALIEAPLAEALVLIILIAAIYVFLEYCMKKLYVNRLDISKCRVAFLIWQILLLYDMCFYIFSAEDIRRWVGLAILAIPLLLYGYICSDKYSKILGLIMTGVLTLTGSFILFSETFMNMYSYMLLTMACFIIIFVSMYIKKNEYNGIIKLIAYLLLIVNLLIDFVLLSEEYYWDNESLFVVVIWILGIINMLGLTTPFSKDWITLEDDSKYKVVNYAINGILMFLSLIWMLNIEDGILHFLMVMGAIGLFSINSYWILKEKRPGLSIYMGIKFTILTLVILASYDAANYVLSIAAFVLAIVFILMGFMIDIKNLRIYGLVVSMICVVKLVMIDITYDNTLGHAISFFISGILCFAISAVYNIAEKKMNRG